MVEQLTFQTIFQFLQTVGILVGIVYYLTIMRNTQRTREISLKAQEEAARAPEDERPLNMTKLCRDDWNMEMEKRYDTIWVRLPHEDIQRNECCNCTKYMRQHQINGLYGKIERHWYFSAIPEISSDKCKDCEWRNPRNF